MKKILALDMGGTSVKAGLYYGSKEKENFLWEHNYRDFKLENAKADLLKRVEKYCGKIDAIGLSIAGLIATDNSLYRSTVLTSFTGFNLCEFLKKELKVNVTTIDNDADCGAIGEWQKNQARFFYVVIGSGIGSAYVDIDGKLPYLTKFEPSHKFSDNDNPIPNDLGLQVALPRDYIYKKFKDLGINKEAIEEVLTDDSGKPLHGPSNDFNSVRVDKFGSSTGIKNILNILLYNQDIGSYYKKMINDYFLQDSPINLKDLYNEKRAAKTLSFFAKKGEPIAREVFKIFGHFLGYGVAKAVEVIRHEHKLNDCLDIRLSGAIMNSSELFEKELISATYESNCIINTVSDPRKANLKGAYLRAFNELENKK